MLNITSISEKGQIVIPKTIRDIMGIKPSDVFSVSLENRKIIVEHLSDIEDVFGMFKSRGNITCDDIKDEYRKAILRKNL